jgi:hypothetical protein
MSGQDTPYRGLEKAGWERRLFASLSCAFVATLLFNILRQPLVPAVVLALCAARVIHYWIRPRPRVSFRRWSWGAVSVILLIILLEWVAPKLTARWISPPLAYAISMSIWVLGMYWIAPADKREGEESRKRVAMAVTVAALLGAALGYLILGLNRVR